MRRFRFSFPCWSFLSPFPYRPHVALELSCLSLPWFLKYVVVLVINANDVMNESGLSSVARRITKDYL